MPAPRVLSPAYPAMHASAARRGNSFRRHPRLHPGAILRSNLARVRRFQIRVNFTAEYTHHKRFTAFGRILLLNGRKRGANRANPRKGPNRWHSSFMKNALTRGRDHTTDAHHLRRIRGHAQAGSHGRRASFGKYSRSCRVGSHRRRYKVTAAHHLRSFRSSRACARLRGTTGPSVPPRRRR